MSWAAYFPGGPGLTGLARGAYRAADGTWDEQNLGVETGNTVYLDDLAVDGEGNALTAWTDSTGTSTAGFDGAGPRFTTFSLPSGPAGQALGFSATADDNWSAVTGISWLFGDGTGAAGAHDLPHVRRARRVHRDRDRDRRGRQRDAALRTRGRRRRADPGADRDP